MRVLVDPNVYVSFLLAPPTSRSPIVQMFRAAALGRFTIVLPPEVLTEIKRVIQSKTYLAKRITLDDVDDLIEGLASVIERVSPVEREVLRIVRDPGDDYLVAQAIESRADLVVSGDKDLVDLGIVGGVRFVTPATFAADFLDAEIDA